MTEKRCYTVKELQNILETVIVAARKKITRKSFRFGKDVMMIPVDEEIVGPESVMDPMKEEVIRLQRQYINE